MKIIVTKDDAVISCSECRREVKEALCVSPKTSMDKSDVFLCRNCLGTAWRSIQYPYKGMLTGAEADIFCPGWRDPYDYNSQIGMEQ